MMYKVTDRATGKRFYCQSLESISLRIGLRVEVIQSIIKTGNQRWQIYAVIVQ